MKENKLVLAKKIPGKIAILVLIEQALLYYKKDQYSMKQTFELPNPKIEELQDDINKCRNLFYQAPSAIYY